MIDDRYKLDLCRAIENITPSYLRGQHFRNFLKCLVSPMQSLNDEFVVWAKEMEIANKVTSQKILLEQYLTNKLRQYFIDDTKRFVIYHKNPITSNTFIYWYSADGDVPQHSEIYVYGRGDTSNSGNAQFVYRPNYLGTSFYVECPIFNESLISRDEYEAKIKSTIDWYRLASKNYKIMYKQ